MRYVIIGNGKIKDYSLLRQYCKGAAVIACDGGMLYCKNADIMPSVIMGDMDSIKSEITDYYLSMNVEHYRFPTHKDFTDMELGLDYALKREPEEIFIFGGIGSRLDHTMANVHILKAAVDKGVRAWLINEHNRVTLVRGHFECKTERGGFVSLLPLTSCAVITTHGLEYPLENYTLDIGRSLGISNRALEGEFSLEVSEGLAIVFLSKD